MRYTVSVVVPNWNGLHLFQKYIKAVVSSPDIDEIIVADDASTDGSAEYIKKYFPAIKVVYSRERKGFAQNVNSGVRHAAGDIIILLNTDVMPDKGFVAPLLGHFTDPDVFAVGCLEKSTESGEITLRGRGLAHWSKGYYIHSRGETDRTDTAWVSAGSGAFRKSMWEKLGGMDTLYNPFYWEDIDLSYRARKSGWKILFEPKSIVHHFHDEGKIKYEFTPTDVNRIVYRNQFIFIWKNLTDPRMLYLHAFWTPVRLIQTVVNGNSLMFQGYVLALQKLPIIMKHRYDQSKIYRRSDRELDM
jgi:O-antigen biosynthesis protein